VRVKARLMAEDAMRRSIRRMAHEILERGGGAEDLVLVGIERRGPALARRIAAVVAEVEGREPPVLAVDPRPFRDDLRLGEPPPPSRRLEGKRVVLVDDVLFTGRTVRAGIEAVLRFGRPKSVELLVLVDRGHRELPIRPDYVGKNVPSARDEEVAVRLVEIDGVDEVLLVGHNGRERRGPARGSPDEGEGEPGARPEDRTEEGSADL
jgi:pyrimidine operon attenuation protein/uracil phosphoribosyltransferase